MPITQQVSSKGNIKKTTNNDLPFSPAQPVISSYYATSTNNQTIINLSFSVQATGTNANTDAFWLFVDGKKLDLGSLNDYTFTSIASDGTSAQVTLNQSLVSNLNIQAFKLGLKPEIQFGMDNRFLQIYAAQNAGFQGFVSQTDFIITPTTTTGTPVAGTFYSLIPNRASMVDLSQDLRPRMGIQRVMFENVYQMQNEYGPNGEEVYGLTNDTFGQVRFIGTWTNNYDTNGFRPGSSGVANVDSFEVTFYGTGMNILTVVDTASRTSSYSVDGGSLTAITPATGNAALLGRNYGENVVIQVVKGLALGIHTVRVLATGTTNITPFGVEILNESSNITVNSGIGYVEDKQYVSGSQSTFAYGSPATGTAGGRVLMYQNGNGSIGTAFTAASGVPQYLSLANHTNEEIARTHSPYEFGASRTSNDDFSGTAGTGGGVRAFTLDDGITTLTGNSVGPSPGVFYSGRNGAYISAGTTEFLQIVFIGTGLDFEYSTDTTARSVAVTVDGVSAGTISFSTAATNVTQKVVSGLNYGTHVVRFTNTQASNVSFTFGLFKVYQPKKPSLPSGTVELGEYNVMANYVAATGSIVNISQGVMHKSSVREMTYVGTWGTVSATIASTGASIDGWFVQTTTATDYVEYSFFGTGIEVYGGAATASNSTNTVQIDGVAYTGAATATNSGTWVAGTSTWTIIASSNSILQITGLSLGLHKVRVTSVTNGIQIYGMSVLAPTYYQRSDIYTDIQSTLPIGSNSVSDNRKTTPVVDSLPSEKAWAVAVGVTSGPSTTSSTLVPFPDMACTIKTTGGSLRISWSSQIGNSVANSATSVSIYVDGQVVKAASYSQATSGNAYVADMTRVQVSPGYHTVQLYWAAGSNTVTAGGTQRLLLVEEE